MAKGKNTTNSTTLLDLPTLAILSHKRGGLILQLLSPQESIIT